MRSQFLFLYESLRSLRFNFPCSLRFLLFIQFSSGSTRLRFVGAFRGDAVAEELG